MEPLNHHPRLGTASYPKELGSVNTRKRNGAEDIEHISRRVSTPTRQWYIDLKENRRGFYLKIRESKYTAIIRVVNVIFHVYDSVEVFGGTELEGRAILMHIDTKSTIAE
eukprot:jgi/Bigna1/126670/aug1.3_g1378